MMPVVAEEIEDYHKDWWMVPGTGIEPVWLAPRDFKSDVINCLQYRTTLKRNCSRPFRAMPCFP
jgi:hypothetical protein